MATTNHERVGKGLALLTKGLAPFVEREQAVHGASWRTHTLKARSYIGLMQSSPEMPRLARESGEARAARGSLFAEE